MVRVRKVLFWVLIAFIVYSVFTSPTQAAEIVRTAWDIIVQGIESIGRFFDALLNRA